MIYAVLKFLHVLSIITWVGGMIFTQVALRPAAASLDAPVRLRLMHGALGRFFRIALVAALVALGSGLWMIGRVAKETVRAGAGFEMPLDWTIMATIGILMIAIFGHIRFALFKRLDRAVHASDWQGGAAALGDIRKWVSVNLVLGLITVAVVYLLP
jgi:uncharacterized membrane protein